jgi:hypothetical protein
MKSENLKSQDLRPGNVRVADYMEVEQRHEQFVVNHVHIFARRTRSPCKNMHMITAYQEERINVI